MRRLVDQSVRYLDKLAVAGAFGACAWIAAGVAAGIGAAGVVLAVALCQDRRARAA